MVTMGILMILLLCSLGVYLFLAPIRFLHKFWWTPLWTKHVLVSQGIKGPSYNFFHGSTKEISNMRNASICRPMDLSHDIFPRILPHIYTWLKVYGEKWAMLRKLSNHAFHGESLKGMIPAMVESVETMLGSWKNYQGKEFDVYEEFRMLTSEVLSRTAFGSSFLEGKQIFQMLRELGVIVGRNDFKIRLSVPGLSRILKNGDDVESDKLEKGIGDLIFGIIQKREKLMMGEGNSYGSDFLGLLLNARKDAPENYKLSLQDIIDECKTFYGAGQGTTSILLAWTVLLLAIHTDWQDKAREEVVRIFGQQNPTSEGIARLRRMNMIFSETLRLYPPAHVLTRKVRRKVRLGKLILPANVNVNIPILALHHDLKIWGEDAHLFNPERFSEGVSKATSNNPAAYIPFGLGPRNCVGLNFATNEAKIALTMILQHLIRASKERTCMFSTIRSCKGMIPAMTAIVEAMLERWRAHQGKEIEAYEEFRILTSEIISRTARGSSNLEGKGIFNMLIKLAVIIFRNEFKVCLPGAGKLFKSSDDVEASRIEQEIHDTLIAFMNMIIKETLRLYCPIANITRRTKGEVRLGIFTLPANVNVLIPPLALHHDPEIWGQDAHLFKPERFAEGMAKATNNNAAAFLSFGFGLRSCVGLTFASHEAEIGLAMIFQHSKFTLLPSHIVMLVLRAMIIFPLAFLCLFLLLIAIWFLYKVWWTPSRIQNVMRLQGIKGPSYKFLYGSTKEILRMRKESRSNPMRLSHDIYPRIQPHVYSWIKLYGKNFLYWLGPQARLVVTEPELIKEILNNKDGACAKPKVQGYMKKLVGDGLGVTEGEKWSKLRKLANHAFHSENLKDMFPARTSSAKVMLERWRHHEGKEIEVYNEFRLLTSEVISRTAFGSSYMEGKIIFDMLMKLIQIVYRNEFKIHFPGIRKEVLDLFGQETPNSEGISRLKTMSLIINETLRLYCPVVNLMRRVTRKVRLGKFILPANVNVITSPLALHHNPEIWGPDAHLFKPERFAEGVAKATNNTNMAFFPFGFGPRACVGLSFTSHEAKIGMSMILQRYKFTLSPSYVHSPVQLLTVRPEHGIQIVLHKI
ncbi:hypothetical protein RJ639_041206 [Escallonia herrerae]|uniref:Cytochrome P450 n=1 Tax=Escallonia herrerae TaxID=1293975 RepID=A0AA88WTH9_9ASTE|nr:hypothetical protein RJ639_041206 [Escallonia herrerae]